MTVLFMALLGRWGQSEMNWYGNDYVRRRIEKREAKWLPITIILDTTLIIYYFTNF